MKRVKEEFVKYFKNVLCNMRGTFNDEQELRRLIKYQVLLEVVERMIRDIEKDETKSTLFSIGDNKVLGSVDMEYIFSRWHGV